MDTGLDLQGQMVSTAGTEDQYCRDRWSVLQGQMVSTAGTEDQYCRLWDLEVALKHAARFVLVKQPLTDLALETS